MSSYKTLWLLLQRLTYAGGAHALQVVLDDTRSLKLPPPGAPSPPKVICLCGSTRFKTEFVEANRRLTLEGHIVLSVGFFSHAELMGNKEEALGAEAAAAIDELHLRKIDMADEILVINAFGYAGPSTRREINYAIVNGKTVNLLYPEKGINNPQPFNVSHELMWLCECGMGNGQSATECAKCGGPKLPLVRTNAIAGEQGARGLR